MKQEELLQISRIYNTLLMVETKGESTIVMGDCLKALKRVVEETVIIEGGVEDETLST